MESLAMSVGNLELFTCICELPSLAERKRIIEGETQLLEAKMEDIRRERQAKKRKVDDCEWMKEGEELVKKVKGSRNPVGGLKSFLLGPKVRWDLYKLSDAINKHSKKGDLLLTRVSSDSGGPCPGNPLPVKRVVGEVASRTLDRLKCVLKEDEIGRIVIHGIEGIGKTFIMKHLYNYGINIFDYVFWVPSPVEFSIKSLQDVIAAVVNCDFASDDNLCVRARKLVDKLTNLGSFAIFLDGVPNADFSVEEVGIPVSAKNSKCKLVLTTSANLGCSKFSSFENVEIERLPKEDEYELFMREANVREGSIPSLGGAPRSLACTCNGVPRAIMNLATRMCGKHDPHEWRCAQFELGRPE